jgi:exodeoxyribonuclease III
MRIATFNVNSIRARKERVLSWLARREVEIVCLQELKVDDASFPRDEIEALGYHAAWHGQKTYNGVAILSRAPLTDVSVAMDDRVEDSHARLIAATTYGLRIISAYFPNGGSMESEKYAYKLEWMRRLREELSRSLDKHELPHALCGDFNVAPFEDDVARPREFEGGVLANPEVRHALLAIAELGLVDVFRPFHPTGGVYSWWDYRGGGFERGNGLRIDHIYASAALAHRCIGAIVDQEERKGEAPSDHAPVIAEFDWSAEGSARRAI